MSKRVQLGLYALLCLVVALAVFFLQMENMFLLFMIYTFLFLMAMQFDQRGIMHSVPTGPYSIQALSIFLGMVGLLFIMLLVDYLVARNDISSFFGLMDSVQKLRVFTHHLPLLVLTGLLGAQAVLGYVITIRQGSFPRSVWQMMDKALILFLLAGILLPLAQISDGLYASVAPVITGEPDILDKEDVYETFAELDSQLHRVHGYALRAWKDANSVSPGETLCVALPGPMHSSETLEARAFPPGTLQTVDEATLLLESWQATLEGILRYERVGETMLLSATASESSASPEGYIVCGKGTRKYVLEDIEASVERFEEARRMLDAWIQANGDFPVPMDTAQCSLLLGL